MLRTLLTLSLVAVLLSACVKFYDGYKEEDVELFISKNPLDIEDFRFDESTQSMDFKLVNHSVWDSNFTLNIYIYPLRTAETPDTVPYLPMAQKEIKFPFLKRGSTAQKLHFSDLVKLVVTDSGTTSKHVPYKIYGEGSGDAVVRPLMDSTRVTVEMIFGQDTARRMQRYDEDNRPMWQVGGTRRYGYNQEFGFHHRSPSDSLIVAYPVHEDPHAIKPYRSYKVKYYQPPPKD